MTYIKLNLKVPNKRLFACRKIACCPPPCLFSAFFLAFGQASVQDIAQQTFLCRRFFPSLYFFLLVRPECFLATVYLPYSLVRTHGPRYTVLPTILCIADLTLLLALCMLTAFCLKKREKILRIDFVPGHC